MTFSVDRRAALGVLGAAGVATAIAVDRNKARQSGNPALLLVDERDADQALAMFEPVKDQAAGPMQQRIVGQDLLRQWRDGLGDEVLEAEQMIALVRWDHALTLEGLAREHNRHTQVNKLSGGLFRLELV